MHVRRWGTRAGIALLKLDVLLVPDYMLATIGLLPSPTSAVITAYIEILNRRKGRAYIMDTTFYNTLSGGSAYDNVSRWGARKFGRID